MLPSAFQFSQSKLQDYVDCPRRFQLRYVQSQAWPAVQAEPLLVHESHLERGARFHRLIQRHQLGLDAQLLVDSIEDDPDLQVWWQDYLKFDLVHKASGTRYPEFTLSTEIAQVRLVATFDLLIILKEERLLIIDWKTYKSAPRRERLAARLQTRVYPYVVTRAGKALFGGEVIPEKLSLIYWIAGVPDYPLIFDYNAEQLTADHNYLSSLIGEIMNRPASEKWPLTPEQSLCRFCEYRSLCDRGDTAGPVDEWEIAETEDTIAPTLADVEEVGF